VARSKAEDKTIGIVQHCDSVPAVLNCFLGCSDALNKYIQSTESLPPEYESKVIEGHLLCRPQAYGLVTALNEAIFLIVTTFYDHLSFYSFPDQYAPLLNRFINFAE